MNNFKKQTLGKCIFCKKKSVVGSKNSFVELCNEHFESYTGRELSNIK